MTEHDNITGGRGGEQGCEFTCYLDVNSRHPELYGDAILPRDDDGMGFSIASLYGLRGRHVRITVAPVDPGPGSPEVADWGPR